MSNRAPSYTLDPVTFEVLKNAFVTIVDQMAEQILRTCHSFVIYARDFSSALCDAEGNTIMQGAQDIAVHVGTLHFTAKAVIEAFADDIHPGDVFAVNDPYLGGTHFNDVRIIRPDLPRRRAHRLRAGQRALGRRRRQRAGLVRHQRQGALRRGPAHPARADLGQAALPAPTSSRLIVSNTRVPARQRGRPARAGRGDARLPSARSCGWSTSTARDTVVTAFGEVQDYVERLTRARIAELPDGDVGDRGLHRLRPGARARGWSRSRSR